MSIASLGCEENRWFGSVGKERLLKVETVLVKAVVFDFFQGSFLKPIAANGKRKAGSPGKETRLPGKGRAGQAFGRVEQRSVAGRPFGWGS